MSDVVPLFEFPRESDELVLLTVAADGQPVTDYQVQAVTHPTRPIDDGWESPTPAGDDGAGYLTGDLPVGLHDLWVKYEANPETPVKLAARIRIT